MYEYTLKNFVLVCWKLRHAKKWDRFDVANGEGI